MRAGVDAATLALYLGGSFDAHTRVRVANGSGTLVNLQGRYQGGALALPNPSTPIASLNLNFIRELNQTGTDSLAPYVRTSTFNRLNDGVTYSPLLQLGRLVTLEVALTAEGGARPPDNSVLWYELFRGVIVRVHWPRRWEPVAGITCADMGYLLQQRKSEVAYTYAAGVPVETAIRQVLDNNGFTTVALNVPVATGKVLSNPYAPGRQKTTWEQVWALAQSIGYLIWYRYTGTGGLALTLFKPSRTKTVPDMTVAKLHDWQELSIDAEEIRNVGYLQYFDGNTQRQEVGPQENAASIAAYGNIRRIFWIVLTESSPVRSAPDATAMLADALSDVADPDVLATSVTTPMFFAEPGTDVYLFPADPKFFTEDQQFAPFAVNWSFDTRAAVGATGAVWSMAAPSNMQVRGAPTAGSKTWIGRGTEAPGPNLQVSTTPSATQFQVAWTGDNVLASLNGALPTTPSGNPIVVPRTGADQILALSATKDGQTKVDTITVPAQVVYLPIAGGTLTGNVSMIANDPRLWLGRNAGSPTLGYDVVLQATGWGQGMALGLNSYYSGNGEPTLNMLASVDPGQFNTKTGLVRWDGNSGSLRVFTGGLSPGRGQPVTMVERLGVYDGGGSAAGVGLVRANNADLQVGVTTVITYQRVLQSVTASAAILTSGLLDDSRLSTNVPRLSAANTFLAGQVVRVATTSTNALTVAVTGETNSRWRMTGSGTQWWGLGDGTYDTNLYRSGIGILRTDAQFAVGTGLYLGAALVLTSGGVLQNVSMSASLLNAGTLDDARLSASVPLKGTLNIYTNSQGVVIAAGSAAFYAHRPGDGWARWHLTSDGVQWWGGGGQQDTNLYRFAAGVLRTDHAFDAGQGLAVGNFVVVTAQRDLVNVVASAGILTSGTLSDLRLSTNVPLKNTLNAYTAAQTVTVASGAGLTLAKANSSVRNWLRWNQASTWWQAGFRGAPYAWVLEHASTATPSDDSGWTTALTVNAEGHVQAAASVWALSGSFAGPDGAFLSVGNTAASLLTSSGNALPLRSGGLLVSTNYADTAPANTLSFGSQTRQMVNLWGTTYGIGVQASTLYMRSGVGYAWYQGGTHSDTQGAPGSGGAALMALTASELTVTPNVFSSGSVSAATYVQAATYVHAYSGFWFAGNGSYLLPGGQNDRVALRSGNATHVYLRLENSAAGIVGYLGGTTNVLELYQGSTAALWFNSATAIFERVPMMRAPNGDTVRVAGVIYSTSAPSDPTAAQLGTFWCVLPS